MALLPRSMRRKDGKDGYTIQPKAGVHKNFLAFALHATHGLSEPRSRLFSASTAVLASGDSAIGSDLSRLNRRDYLHSGSGALFLVPWCEERRDCQVGESARKTVATPQCDPSLKRISAHNRRTSKAHLSFVTFFSGSIAFGGARLSTRSPLGIAQY